MVTFLFLLFDKHVRLYTYVCLTPGNFAVKHHLCQSQPLFLVTICPKKKQPKILFLSWVLCWSFFLMLNYSFCCLQMYVENAKFWDNTGMDVQFFFSVQRKCMYMYSRVILRHATWIERFCTFYSKYTCTPSTVVMFPFLFCDFRQRVCLYCQAPWSHW